MQDQLISFKTAIVAKEKGFDEYTLSGYITKEIVGKFIDSSYEEYRYGGEGSKEFIHINHVDRGFMPLHEPYYKTPTQSLLHKWLREKHNLFIEIFLTSEGNYTINSIVIIGESEYAVDFKLFDEYEDALEEGLYEALLLI